MANKYYKYPSTPHVTGSKKLSKEDVSGDVSVLYGKDVVITEKMDGESTSVYNDKIHARSIDSNNHPSRNYIKGKLAAMQGMIPNGVRICGENLYAKHSIHYTNLEDYFLVFSLWNEELCYEWDNTVQWCGNVGLCSVPVLYRGPLTEMVWKNLVASLDTNKQEGIVIRNAGQFLLKDFQKNVFKWVRPNHVQTDEHWTKQPIVPNKLKNY